MYTHQQKILNEGVKLMLKAKKILSALMALGVAMSMTACKSSKPTADLPDASKIDTSKFVTVNFVMTGDKPTNGQLEKVMAKVNDSLKKSINANLELKWVEWADYYTKYNLLLASGESLDLISTASDWLDLWPNAQKGAFKTLDQLLPVYAPETYKEVPQDEWAQCKYDGKIVNIPEDHYTQWVNHGFFYRGDWAKEFGISQIKDWATFGKYLQGIKDKKTGVVPYDVNGGSATKSNFWFQSTSKAVMLDAVPTGLGVSLFYGKSVEDYASVYSPYFDDTFTDYAKMMKQWGDAGYWREDVLNFKGDTRAELKAGKTGTDQHHTQTYLGLRTDMDKQQPGSELQMFSFSDQSNNLVTAPITHGGTSVGANSKNPERALMVYEQIRQNKEVYQLFNYGIEGVQYAVKDGKRTTPDGYDSTRDGFSSNFWGGRVDKFEIPSATIYSGYPEIYKKYDAIKKTYPYGRFVFDKQPIESELAAISDVVNQQLPAISWGKAGDPAKAVDTFRTKLKSAGYDKVLAEVQKQMTAYKKMVDSGK